MAVTCSDWQCAAKLKITRKSGMGLLSSPDSRQETAALHGACSARGIWNIKFAPRTPLVPRPALEAASPTGSLSARAILTRSSRLEACRPAIGRSDVPQSGQSGRPVPSMMCTCIQIYRLVVVCFAFKSCEEWLPLSWQRRAMTTKFDSGRHPHAFAQESFVIQTRKSTA